MGIRNVPERGLTAGIGPRHSLAAGALTGAGPVEGRGVERGGGGGGLAWT